ncbi:MAG: hypothetical protein NTV82_15875 [Candidatus Aminicenantes bacterium]|nr:hypothetical protein [Candidatus Aminicenantes bacterium]
MSILYDLLKFLHIMSFVFMSVPLFNLIVVNERALFSSSFNYSVDRYMENIIKHGAYRCFVFQSTVFVTGVLLLVFGPLGIKALWSHWIIILKTILLFTLMGLLSYVHFKLQPKIEKLLSSHGPDALMPNNLFSDLKIHRSRRKRMATFCLFIVITIIILGLQVYSAFSPVLTLGLIGLAGLFAWRVSKTIIRFGWI